MASVIHSSKKAIGVISGGLIIFCSFMLMWSSVSTEFEVDEAISEAAARSTEIDVTRPDPTMNGTLVIAAGELTSIEKLEDELLKPGPYLVLERRVEMYQWNERFVEDSTEPTYKLEWLAGQRDFFSFQRPQGHENPLLPMKPEIKRVGQVSFGRFDGTQILSRIQVFEPLNITPALLKDPSQEIVENRIMIRRGESVGTGPSLGDVRVSYSILPRGEYTVLTEQVDERTLLGASPSETLVVRHGLLSTEDFVRGVERDAKTSTNGALFMGGGLLFLGLLSLLVPHREKFDLRPHLNVQGSLAVFVVSGGLSVLAMLAFSIVGLTR